MIKVVAALRRRPGLTHEEYVGYVSSVHAGIASANKMTVQRYVQNHVFDGSFGRTGDPTHLNILPRDSVTELWFEDVSGLAACFADPYTRDVVGPDGVNFSDMPNAISLLVEQGPDRGVQATTGVKALWFLKARDGQTRDEFVERWATADDRAGRTDGVSRRISEPALVLDPAAGGGAGYFGGHEAIRYEGLQSLWLDPECPARAMRQYEEAALSDGPDWLDASQSFWLLATEYVVY